MAGVIRWTMLLRTRRRQSGNEALKSYDFAFGSFSFTSADPPDPGF